MKIQILAFSLVFTVSLLVAIGEIAIVEGQKSPRKKRDFPSAEANADGHKKSKPNPPYISSSSSPFLQGCLAQENQQFSPLSAVKFNWKEDLGELGSMDLMAAEQLSKRPKIGGIYEANRVHRESTVKRLRELCNEELTIDAGIEMADAASLLKLMSSLTDETIESAGQKAHRGALLLLQAEILRKNGLQLLSESQKLFKDIL